jgi:transcriptional regulator of arginine metabolism
MNVYTHADVTATAHSPVQRRARIAALIGSTQVWSQQELATLLKRREGIAVTQATLSRDLTELAVVKGPNGYMMPGTSPTLPAGDREAMLATALRQHLVSVARGGTLVVLRTPSGHANSLAIELDRAGLPGTLGTIAGDDTIFVAAEDLAAATSLARTIERLARSAA